MKIAQKAAATLSAQGIETAILHVPTIKPLDTDTIVEYCEKIPNIVVIEEHSVVGGLGSAVAEVVAEANFESPKKFKKIGLPDVFPDKYGSQDSLMKEYAITEENLVASIEEALVAQGKLVT